MTHNIEGFEEYYAFIRTTPIYIKFVGMCEINANCKVIAETEKAVLIREWNGNNYSMTTMWISKSKIISLIHAEYLETIKRLGRFGDD